MSPEALVLALSGVVRPTSAAAIYAMLATRSPRRLLIAYLVAGLTFSLAVGAAAVVIFHGHMWPSRSDSARPVLDLVLGAGAIGYAAGAGTGLLPRRNTRRAPDEDSWLQRRLAHLSPRSAALAGVVTHLPGIVYLAALNAIIATAAKPVGDLLQVLIYNLIWFSPAIAALVMSILRPDLSRAVLEDISSWGRRHRRLIVVVVIGAVGVYLVVKGIVDLR